MINYCKMCFLWIAKALSTHLKAFICQSHSGHVHTHSKACMLTQLHSGDVQTHSKALMHTQFCIEGVFTLTQSLSHTLN